MKGWNLNLRFEWKVQDLWLGVFWKHNTMRTDIWICLLPCVPLHVSIWRVRCLRCDALVKRLYTDSAGVIEACCIECAWNPNGCRCRFGEFGVADTGFYACFPDEDDL